MASYSPKSNVNRWVFMWGTRSTWLLQFANSCMDIASDQFEFKRRKRPKSSFFHTKGASNLQFVIYNITDVARPPGVASLFQWWHLPVICLSQSPAHRPIIDVIPQHMQIITGPACILGGRSQHQQGPLAEWKNHLWCKNKLKQTAWCNPASVQLEEKWACLSANAQPAVYA